MHRNRLALVSVMLLLVSLLALKCVLEPRLRNRFARPNLKPIEAGYQGASLKRLSPGMDSFIAALLWVQLLQQASHERIKDDKVSWEYAQIDAIATLEPRFERVYDFGHAFLSVFRRDKIGAKLILERWAKLRPNYWKPHYLLGYHLYFEMREHAAASKSILRASQMMNAPKWLAALGVRLLEQDFAFEQALRIAIELYPQSNEVAKERLKLRIRTIRYSQEKQRLENAVSKYRRAKGKLPKTLEAARPYLDANINRTLSSIQIDSEDAQDLVNILSERFEFAYDGLGKVQGVGASASLDRERLGIFPSRE